MKPLIVLLVTFVIAAISEKLINGNYEPGLAARIAMSVMLLFTASAHFVFTSGMGMMVPNFMPLKKELVYFTGVIEILVAIGIHVAAYRTLTAWLLILFFLLILPANIRAAIRHIDYQKGTTEGNGITYLWFRVPLQILFIVWIYVSCIRL